MHKNDLEVLNSAMATLSIIIAAVILYIIDWIFLGVIVSLCGAWCLFCTAHVFSFRKYEYVNHILTKTR